MSLSQHPDTYRARERTFVPAHSSMPESGLKNIQLTQQEFSQLRTLVYDRFGINLTEQKHSLLAGRLQKMLHTSGYKSFQDYYDDLIADRTGKKLSDLINRVSTNYSYFFREEAHFNYFTKTALPFVVTMLQQKGSNDLRLWTAGCSTGEEPYSLVMLLFDYFGINYSRWDAGILATDISERVLKIAQEAIYPIDRIQRVPVAFRHKYFINLPNKQVQVRKDIREQLTIRRFNLMNSVFPFKKPFHMIFCRNVMIYFDKETREALVKRFHQFLEPGGYLFIGHSETLGREQKLFRYIMPACYQKI